MDACVLLESPSCTLRRVLDCFEINTGVAMTLFSGLDFDSLFTFRFLMCFRQNLTTIEFSFFLQQMQSSSTSKDILGANDLCPPAAALPCVRTIPSDFYELRSNLPWLRRHYVFLGQVTDSSDACNHNAQHRVVVRDRTGVNIDVTFHFEKDAATTFRFKDIVNDSTIAIMYAERDEANQASIRVDALDYVAVFPHPLDEMLTNDTASAALVNMIPDWRIFKERFYTFPMLHRAPPPDDFFGKSRNARDEQV